MSAANLIGDSTPEVKTMSSSTPIRIVGGSGSFHGAHTGSTGHLHIVGAGNESSSPGGVSSGGGGGVSVGGGISGGVGASGSAGLGSGSGPGMAGPDGIGGQQQQSAARSATVSVGTPTQSLGVAAGTGTASNSNYGGISSSVTPPNSAGLRQAGAVEFKFKRRKSLRVNLPKRPSTESLSNSPGPSSPGLTSWATDRDKYDGNQTDRASAFSDSSKLNRKESYKAQRKTYRLEKKRVASELLNSLQDPAVIVLADWLKVRGTLKSWTKLWCVLKPGLLLLYKSPKQKSSHWVGTILLTSCQVIERPSKKDGFCFKLFHPLEQSIWAPRGPDKETIGAVVQPLPTSYLIFRAPSQAAGKCWMDALELSLRCSALLLRSNNNATAMTSGTQPAVGDTYHANMAQISHETQWSDADYRKHFDEHDAPSSHEKRFSQYLTVPECFVSSTHRSSGCSSDVSLPPSRSPTPIFQQLYMTMTHWEHLVASTPEFQKIKNFRKFRKTKRSSTGGGDGSAVGASVSGGEFSDASSVDFSPTHASQKRRLPSGGPLPIRDRSGLFTKSASLGSGSGSPQRNSGQRQRGSVSIRGPVGVGVGGRDRASDSWSSDDFDDDDDDIDGGASGGGAITDRKLTRPVSAPPIVTPTAMLAAVKDLDGDSPNEAAAALMSGMDSDSDSEVDACDEDTTETTYVAMPEEEFGQAGETVEELAEENKSLLWMLVKQVRPGMDLSKVVLPTFILEPRSFLDKLADSYYHADIISQAVHEEDPFDRMKYIVQWYLSSFYKKPKGLKKPYNPILGERFRCQWLHPNGSRTFYVSEQVSHHPPVSAFYVSNRQDGFVINCSITAKSKFYGNSTSAVLEGVATLTLLPCGESYTLTTPYAHCKGILMGTLTMELGGKILIECAKTGYRTELEFKLKPFLGSADSTNVVTGKIKFGKDVLATINGHWDREIRIKDTRTNVETIMFTVNRETKAKRLMRFVVPVEEQYPDESERLWLKVSDAIKRDDQVGATEEKTKLEEMQRKGAKERKELSESWIPQHFSICEETGQWVYNHENIRPWDETNDIREYECQFRILTKTKHKQSLISTCNILTRPDAAKLKNKEDLSDSDGSAATSRGRGVSSKTIKRLAITVDKINEKLDEQARQLAVISARLDQLKSEKRPTRHTTMGVEFLPMFNRSTLVPSSVDLPTGIAQYVPAGLRQPGTLSAICMIFGVAFLGLILRWSLK